MDREQARPSARAALFTLIIIGFAVSMTLPAFAQESDPASADSSNIDLIDIDRTFLEIAPFIGIDGEKDLRHYLLVRKQSSISVDAIPPVEFDGHRIIEDISFNTEGSPTNFEFYFYDSRDRLVGRQHYTQLRSNSPNVTWSEVFQYDDADLIWGYQFGMHGELTRIFRNLYTDSGLGMQIAYDPNGEPTGRFSIGELGEDGEYTVSGTYVSPNKPAGTTLRNAYETITYDENGSITQRNTRNAENTGYDVLIFNENGAE